MTKEQKELYTFTNDKFKNELNEIPSDCIVSITNLVKLAVNEYVRSYCSNNQNPFSSHDIAIVSNTIYNDNGFGYRG